MRILLYTVSVLLLILSCSGSDKRISIEPENIFPSDSLSVFFGLPMFAEFYDNKLFVMDQQGEESFIKVIDVTADSLLFSIARKGNGPNEYLSVSSIDIYNNSFSDAIIGLYDLMNKVYRTYSYFELCELQHYAQPILTKEFPDKRFSSIIRLDSMYLATDLSGKSRFIIYDNSFENERPVGDYRPKPAEAFPDELHALLHNGRTFVSSDRKTIGNVIFKAELLSLFTANNHNMTSKWDYVIKEMDYEPNGNGYILKTRKGYLSGAITSKYVYGLYCGKEDDEDSFGTELDVFSHDGELLKRYCLSQPAFGICIDEDNKNLYTLVHVPEPSILIYHFDEI